MGAMVLGGSVVSGLGALLVAGGLLGEHFSMNQAVLVLAVNAGILAIALRNAKA